MLGGRLAGDVEQGGCFCSSLLLGRLTCQKACFPSGLTSKVDIRPLALFLLFMVDFGPCWRIWGWGGTPMFCY